MKKIEEYISRWMGRGYPNDIPDEVPDRLMDLGLAPSYRAIAIAILSNDSALTSLGFTGKKSKWYYELKRTRLAGVKE